MVSKLSVAVPEANFDSDRKLITPDNDREESGTQTRKDARWRKLWNTCTVLTSYT